MTRADAQNAFVVGVGFVVVFEAVVIVLGVRYARRKTPQAIVRRLRERPGLTIGVRARPPRLGIMTVPFWDPSRRLTPENLLWTPGRGVYWLDETGLVHLDFNPEVPKGSAPAVTRQLVGPIPNEWQDVDTAPVRRLRLLLIVPALCAAGFALACWRSTGSRSDRVTLAAIVAALIWLTTLLGISAIRMVWKWRSASRLHKGNSGD